MPLLTLWNSCSSGEFPIKGGRLRFSTGLSTGKSKRPSADDGYSRLLYVFSSNLGGLSGLLSEVA
jgi:hypothetical protein